MICRILLVWSLLVMGAGAQELRVTPARIDLGTVTVGDPVAVSLTLDNPGPEAVTIRAISTGCSGCLEVLEQPASVAPEASATVRMHLHSRGRRGREQAFIRIRHGSDGTTDLVVPFTCTIDAPLLCRPGSVVMGQLSEAPLLRTVLVTGPDDRPPQAVIDDERFRLVWGPRHPDGSHSLQVHVDDLPAPGPVQAVITLTRADGRSMELPLSAVVPPPVAPVPARVLLPPPPLRASAQRIVRLRATGPAAGTLPQVASLSLEPLVEGLVVTPGPEHQIQITAAAGLDLRPVGPVTLTVTLVGGGAVAVLISQAGVGAP